MKLKRYSLNRLIDKCTDIFYDYMITEGKDIYAEGCLNLGNKEGVSPIDFIYNRNLRDVQTAKQQIEVLKELTIQGYNNHFYDLNIRMLLDHINLIETTNYNTQRERFEKTNTFNYARTAVYIPLNKKINAFYDDLVLEVYFFDNICTLNGIYDQYKNLKTRDGKLSMFKGNTRIISMNLFFLRNGYYIAHAHLSGVKNFNPNILNIGSQFVDFNKLTLSDINSFIGNNDLRQILQSKIDLEKEDLTELVTKNVGNDQYSVYTTETPHKILFIKYTCPSTGRVYFNELDEENLSKSSYFKKNEYTSYIDAWWSIAHLGANPYNVKPMIRC